MGIDCCDAPQRLTFSMSAELSNIDAVCERSRAFLRDNGCGEESFAILLGIREALSNAMIHGCALNPGLQVRCDLGLCAEGVRVRVEDLGLGFDWRSRSLDPPGPEATSGRGLAILSKYFDVVTFHDRGARVELIKTCPKGERMSEIRRTGTSVVVKPGRDIVSSMAADFREELKSLLAEGVTEMTIDMAGVAMLDSIGMGLLIAAHNSLAKGGGKLKLVNATHDILGLLKTMRLDKHFDIVVG